MNNTIENVGTANQASVSRLAYQLWENAGRPTGRDLEFWLAAEGQLRPAARPASSAAVTGQPPTVKPAQKTPPNARGTKKNWPKPYPALPKF